MSLLRHRSSRKLTVPLIDLRLRGGAQILRLKFALPPGKAVEGIVTLNPLTVYRERASYLALGAVQENPHKQDSVVS